MENTILNTSKDIKMYVNSVDDVSNETARAFITVADEYEKHVVVMKKNSKGHWEMENRSDYPDWVLEREADFIRLLKTEEKE